MGDVLPPHMSPFNGNGVGQAHIIFVARMIHADDSNGLPVTRSKLFIFMMKARDVFPLNRSKCANLDI